MYILNAFKYRCVSNLYFSATQKACYHLVLSMLANDLIVPFIVSLACTINSEFGVYTCCVH